MLFNGIFIDGIYIRTGMDTDDAKNFFLNMMLLSILSLGIGILLTIVEI
jgi:hypothetical protein